MINVWNFISAVSISFLMDVLGRKLMFYWSVVFMIIFLSLMAALSAVIGSDSDNQSGKTRLS